MSGSRRATLSVVVPTKDASDLLAGCLASVAWADELIVVDMFSQDGVEKVCARFPNSRLIQREDYIFGNVNHGIDEASSDWILRIDTDERVTPELADDIKGILADPPSDVTGFALWERPVILGREFKHGFGLRHHRKMLFRRGAARYAVQSEHEDLETSGRWVETETGYLHYNYTSVGQYLRKTDYYTSRDVERAILPERPPSGAAAVRLAAGAFWLHYVRWQGFREGWEGLVDAGMRALYPFVEWAKLRERWEIERRGTAMAPPELNRPAGNRP